MQLKILKKDFWRGQRLILLAFFVGHTICSFYYISQHNITFDEPDYMEYAKRWLQGKPERIMLLDDSKSPIVAVCWVPRIIRQWINPSYQLNDYGRKDQKEGRYMMILFSFITMLYVYWWCRDLYGDQGWYLPLVLLLFDPLYLAYSTIITTDSACGSFLVALLYHFRRYLVLNSKKDFWLTALFTGVGIVTKQTLLFVLILLPLIYILYYKAVRTISPFRVSTSVIKVFLFVAVILLVVNAGYYFHKSFIPLGTYNFESAALINVQERLSFLHWFPVPLPFPYVQSVDMIKAHAELGAGKPESTYDGIYLFRELKLKGNYWYYYLVHLSFKMPIGTLLLSVACIPIFFKRFKVDSFARQYLFLIGPIVFYLVVLSFFNQFKTGLRHLLLIFPLLYIGMGYLFKVVSKLNWKYKACTAAAILYTLITVAVYFPYIIPYTNEFVSNKKTVYRKIWDSSVDYGQSDSSVVEFVAAHPEYKRATSVPDTGRYAVLSREMMNTYLKNSNPYRWYQSMEPKGQYRYVLLLFDVTRADLEKADWKKAELKIIE